MIIFESLLTTFVASSSRIRLEPKTKPPLQSSSKLSLYKSTTHSVILQRAWKVFVFHSTFSYSVFSSEFSDDVFLSADINLTFDVCGRWPQKKTLRCSLNIGFLHFFLFCLPIFLLNVKVFNLNINFVRTYIIIPSSLNSMT